MGDIVNLNKARKARARAAAEKTAAANRVKFGQKLTERQRSERETDRRDAELDGKKLIED